MKYPRGWLESGQCSAHQIVAARCVEQKIRNEKEAWFWTKNALKFGSKRISLKLRKITLKGLVCLQSLFKKFLEVQTRHMKYPRCWLEPGQCSARQIMVVRCVEQKIRNETEAWFWTKNNSKIEFQKVDYTWAKSCKKCTTVTSKSLKKFSRSPKNTSEVS